MIKLMLKEGKRVLRIKDFDSGDLFAIVMCGIVLGFFIWMFALMFAGNDIL